MFEPLIADHSSIKVIGLGGVGGIVARYGALFLAGLGRSLRLVLIDGDAFEPANAGRMFVSGAANKAEALRDELLASLPGAPLTILAVPEFVTPGNSGRLIHDGDVVLLAVDNHASRKLVSDFCAAHRSDVCLISGGNDGVETSPGGRVLRGTYGNCQVYVRRGGRDLSPPLTRHHPEIERPADRPPAEMSCAGAAARSPQILFANLMAAACMLNALWLHLSGELHYGEICFDVADGLMRPVSPGPAAPGGKEAVEKNLRK